MTMEGQMSLFRVNVQDEYDGIHAEVSFITDLQLEIEAAMDRNGLTQGALAKKLGVSEARVSQILSQNGANLEARTIAKIAYRLGMKASIRFSDLEATDGRRTNRTTSLAQWSREHTASKWAGSWARAIASNEDGWVPEAPPVKRMVGA